MGPGGGSMNNAAKSVLAHIRKYPGAARDTTAHALGLTQASVSTHYRTLKKFGLVAAIPPAGKAARWYPAGPHLAGMWEKQRSDALEREQARKRENWKLAAEARLMAGVEDHDIDPPIIKRIVSAHECKPIRPLAPHSVFHLGAP